MAEMAAAAVFNADEGASAMMAMYGGYDCVTLVDSSSSSSSISSSSSLQGGDGDRDRGGENIISESFDLSEEEAYCEYFRRHGVVVVRNVLTREEIKASLDEMWEHEALLGGLGVARDDLTAESKTWKHWPTEAHGFLHVQPGHSQAELKQLWLNRQNLRVIRVFQRILACRELRLLQRDRLSLMPPTREPPTDPYMTNATNADSRTKFRTDSRREYPERRTRDGWLHWDQNPWACPNFMGVQGSVTFTRHTATSGGFLCVPDFPPKFTAWAKTNLNLIVENPMIFYRDLVRVPKSDALCQETCKVLAPAGSVIIWDSRTPHCNYSNNDHTFRACQYVSYEPVDGDRYGQNTNSDRDISIQTLLDRAKPGQPFPACLSLLGQKVNGIIDWNATECAPLHDLVSKISKEAQAAMECIHKAEALESEGQLQEAIQCYKKARRLCPDVCNEYGI